ncbi:hypothetical protein CUT44_00025 [Streptomyces carminius]|uniref:DUF2703 domain-containing protein n=1 Tax=Streptomyces carminius TaxID=2665496 RepID=A0A2M8MCT9_9ACTN|nr:DUF2703 domain-containing protein [Streptomyces carminius]PJF01994.1 hypothetical protein CUT44_00025 [Streptomyces carminius]
MTATDASPAPGSPPSPEPGARLAVDYWTVAMEGQDSCGACDETFATLTRAADTVRPLAAQLGITLDITRRTVATWQEAVEHGIRASPALRAAGTELRPAHPDDSEARVWSWRGAHHASLPLAAAVDFLLRAVAARSAQLGDFLSRGGPSPYLRRFLTASAAEAPAAGAVACGPSGSCG